MKFNTVLSIVVAIFFAVATADAATLTVEEKLELAKAGYTKAEIEEMEQAAPAQPAEASEESDDTSLAAKAMAPAKKVGKMFTSPFGGGDKNSAGGYPVFFEAGLDDGFPVQDWEDSASDLAKRAGKEFQVVPDEDQAQYKVVVVGRGMEERNGSFMNHKSKELKKNLQVAVMAKSPDGEWKPLVKIQEDGYTFKGAADNVIKSVRKFLEKNL